MTGRRARSPFAQHLFSRSASACFATARCSVSGSWMSPASTLVTFTPAGARLLIDDLVESLIDPIPLCERCRQRIASAVALEPARAKHARADQHGCCPDQTQGTFGYGYQC